MGLISRVSSRTYREQVEKKTSNTKKQQIKKMNAQFLHQEAQLFTSSGSVLSSEQQTQLANSLTITKHNNKFSKIFFWGKIYGIKEDYLIAQGISGADELTEKTNLYSVTGNDWHLLATPDAKSQEDALKIQVDLLEILCTSMSSMMLLIMGRLLRKLL